MIKIGMYVDASNLYKKDATPIDYRELRQFAEDKGELLRCNIYVSVDPENPKPVKGFISALRDMGYKVIEKGWVRDSEGRIKANMDMDLAIDMLLEASNLDVLILVSGDSDFVRLVRAVQAFGKRVECIAFRERTSYDLIREVDEYTALESIPGIFMEKREEDQPVGVDNDPKDVGY